MNINKHNYEAFFLDYHEGNLSPQEVADLLLFVEQHPELKEEFENYENVMLEDFSTVVFDGKSELKKQITIENKEEYFIKSVEGILSNTEEKLLTDFLKQHPRFRTDFELFQKTKLIADTSVVYENRQALKQVTVTDNLLISAVEGLLNSEEKIWFDKQLATDKKLKNEFALYQETKLAANPFIVYENKNELKRQEKKVIPLYYYMAAAASMMLLLGLFFLFNKEEQPIAKNNIVPVIENKMQIEKLFDSNSGENVIAHASDQNEVMKKKIKSTNPPVVQNNLAISENKEETNLAVENVVQEIPLGDVSKEQTIINKDVSVLNERTEIAKTEISKTEVIDNSFSSLGELIAVKIKEKTLDENTLAVEKKTNRFKKLSGWDVLQLTAKGISKLTGKKVEVKPTYNEEGEVTAYAFNAGNIEVSRRR